MTENQAPAKVEPAHFFFKRQIHWLLLCRVLALSVLLAVAVLSERHQDRIPLPPGKYIFTFIIAVYLFTIISAFILKRATRLVRFAYSQIFLDIFLTSILVLFTGGSQSLFSILYFFPIISSGLILYRLGTFFIATTCSLCYGAILFLEFLDYYPQVFFRWNSPLNDISVAAKLHAFPSLTFFLIAFLSSMLSERLRKTEAALSTASLHLDRLSVLYKQIFDDITTGIITIDGRGTITSFNRAAGEITGYKQGEIIGGKLNHYFPGLERPTQNMPRPVSDLKRKDGVTIPVGFSWSILNMPGENPEKSRVFTFQDLSHIKKMENQVRQAEKMAGIGEMAAGVAHEFRNPLAAISGAAQVLREESADKPANQRLMDIIVRECDRLEVSIAEFLQFSKPASPEKKWFSLSALVNDLLLLLRKTPSWDPFDLQADVPEPLDLCGDQNQIKQVFLNLLANSRQAMGKTGGSIRIIAREEKVERLGDHILIEIHDSGPGIKPEIMSRIFEPFFTTREKGTGLGLAIVWQIIESHDGTISVHNAPDNRGACFIITLPLP